MIWKPQELPVDSEGRAEDDSDYPEKGEKLQTGFC